MYYNCGKLSGENRKYGQASRIAAGGDPYAMAVNKTAKDKSVLVKVDIESGKVEENHLWEGVE